MGNKKYIEPQNGLLTEKMDVNTPEFAHFQAIILNKSRQQSRLQKANIELAAIKIQIEDYIKSGHHSEPKLLGEFLKSFLTALNIRQNKLASYMEMEPSNLSKVLNGERQINSEIALKFGRIFGLDPLVLLEIQAKNEILMVLSQKREQFKKYSLEGLIEVA